MLTPSHQRLYGTFCALFILYFLCAQWAGSRFGRADNGDFTRSMGRYVTRPVGFRENWPAAEAQSPAAAAEHRQRFFNCYLPFWELQHDRAATSGYAHSVHLLWWPGFLLNKAAFSGKILDLAWLGLFPRLLVSLAWLGVLGALYRQRAPLAPALLLAATLALIFSDAAYTSFFNSFYQETGAVVFLSLLTLGFVLLAGGAYRPSWTLIFAALILYCSAKPQYLASSLVIGAAVLAAYNMAYFWDRPLPARHLRTLTAAASLLALAGAGAFILLTFPDFNARLCATHRYFTGVLTVSRDPAAHLARKGLPPSYVKYVGEYFIPETSVGTRDLVSVVAHEPAIPFRMIARAAAQLQDVRLDYLKTTPINFPDPKLYQPGFAIWSAFKKRFFPRGPLYLVFAGVVLTLNLGLLRLRDTRLRRLNLILFLCNAAAFLELLAALGEGFWEYPKHLLAANLFFDLTLSFLLFLLMQLRPSRFARRPPEFRETLWSSVARLQSPK